MFLKSKKLPFDITNTMIDYVAEITNLIGKLTSINQLSDNLLYAVLIVFSRFMTS